jgi:RND family efflux transporter MFP subunit
LSQARASREIASSRRAELEAKLLEAGKHLAACEVRATVSGLAIYQKVFFGSEHRKIQVGDQVWPNQPLIMLPELAQMVVETRVRETDVHKVEKNQEVAVRVDAYPGLQLGGSVSFIGTLAQEERRDGGAPGSGKYFQVTVELEGTDPRLRPGMSARVELVVEKVESARFVPLEAVFERGGRYFCLVVERGQPRPREVLTGTSNEHFIVIEAGLDPGERVLMGDPRGSEAAPVIERGFELPSPLTPE